MILASIKVVAVETKKKKKMDLEAHNTESANRPDIKGLLEF